MYGYTTWKNGKTTFRSFKTFKECMRSVRRMAFIDKSCDEFEIVQYTRSKHPTDRYSYTSDETLVGFAFVSEYNFPVYRYVKGTMAYPIKADGSLDKKRAYEIIPIDRR